MKSQTCHDTKKNYNNLALPFIIHFFPVIRRLLSAYLTNTLPQPVGHSIIPSSITQVCIQAACNL